METQKIDAIVSACLIQRSTFNDGKTAVSVTIASWDEKLKTDDPNETIGLNLRVPLAEMMTLPGLQLVVIERAIAILNAAQDRLLAKVSDPALRSSHKTRNLGLETEELDPRLDRQ